VKILHITSDWKWTGPAEPMLGLLQALRERGHEVDLACAEPVEPGEPVDRAVTGVSSQARARGVVPCQELLAARGLRWRRDTPDVRRLHERITAERIDVIHAWHSRDHALAIRAAWGTRAAVVRTLPSADPVSRAPWNRWLLGPGTDGLLCVSQEASRQWEGLRGGRPIAACLGAVDNERFRPRGRADEGALAQLRAKLGLEPGAPVIGIVARVQRHRRFELLLHAMRELAKTHADTRLVVVGRGTHIDEVARKPARDLGIAEQVVFAGYREDDYALMLRVFDLFSFLVPGSDGTCRALLEAAASGLPAVATRRGALAEIVADGESGVLVDEAPEALAAAWRGLLDDPARRARLAAGARRRACREFCPERLAQDVESLYSAAISTRTVG